MSEDNALYFVREYKHCKCQGWDEIYVGIQKPKRNMSGELIANQQPNGVRLSGRSNHRRNCSKNAIQ